MRKCYLDNASTTCQKPDAVLQAVINTMKEVGCSPGRGGYQCALQSSRIILRARMAAARFFNVSDSRQVIFVPSVTYALNYALKGLLKLGDHVVTSSIEHNAVVRPLRQLERQGLIELTIVQCDQRGLLNPSKLEAALRPNTKLIVLNHASNVVGTIQPIQEVGEIARKHGLWYVVDCAQTAGYLDVDFQKIGADVLTFTGHKGLFGPPGSGGFIVNERAGQEMEPLVVGGTGSVSDSEYQPDFLPDKFESGTKNTPALAGLHAGLEFLQSVGLENIRKHEKQLLEKFLQGLKALPKVKVYGPGDSALQVPTVSLAIAGYDISELSFLLDDRYGIMTRSGIHCAPLAHKTVGSFPAGTVRFSIGYFNTEDDIDYALKCLREFSE